ncbi:MAG: Na+/H+ antiporter NhaC family protein [Candidatus Marinimicrobia bacterium]|jgi:Na+/H+ antiporter NhaC|nr:Na+/H+ antiporter NhaC family protein [Candidatus Neomarinimicrobiota bacterium]MDP6820457.1 Na+/H+ antiporter NhaC family protein [Candidatus Neomarinimicrobiota bacterium]|tara:strand:+ start:828 stop:2489 length:1662 start_codon:yes stop_codon:yes gene_type:complete
MKLIQSYKIPAVLLILILGFVFASETGSISSGAGEYSILSILPPLFAILLALVTHEAHLSLFIGIWLGSTLVVQHPISGLTYALDTYMVQTVTDHGHASILIFTMVFGGLIGVISANGGMAGAVHAAARYATSNRRSQLATVLMGFVIFFDDYANTLLVGNMMRPFTDRVKISREKLSYLVDSTAAPVASLAIISSWSVFQMSLLESPFEQFGISVNPYFTFIQSIPFSFYCILTLVFILINVMLKREYGPMHAAENRAISTGKVLADNAKPLLDPSLMQGKNITPSHWSNAFIPIGVVVAVTIGGLIITGLKSVTMENPSLRDIIGAADPYASLIWGSCISSITAIGISVGKGVLNLEKALESWVNGVRSMVMACIILVLAWTIGSVCKDLHTAEYLVSISSNVLTPNMLPFITFGTAAAISFSTGSSWATMSILIPVVVPMALHLMTLDPNAVVESPVFLATFASVLSGSVFGDHCSPISDTTILSSTASASDHIDHVKTQMPYALTVGVLAMTLGCLGVGFGVPVSVILITGSVILFVIIRYVGQPVRAV